MSYKIQAHFITYKIPAGFGIFLSIKNLWEILKPVNGITWIHCLLMLIYAILNVLLIALLVYRSEAISLRYGAAHWMIVLIIAAYLVVNHVPIYSIPLEIMLLVLPVLGPFIPLGSFDCAFAAEIGIAVYAGAMLLTCLFGAFRKRSHTYDK